MDDEKQLMKRIFKETKKDVDFGLKMFKYSTISIFIIIVIIWLVNYLSASNLQVIPSIAEILITIAGIGFFVGIAIMGISINVQEKIVEYILQKKTREQQKIMRCSREKTNKTKKNN